MRPDRENMRRYSDPVDVCIIGAGAGGSVLAKELAEGGLSVVVIEAGPWLDTVEDFVNDELETYGRLDWEDTRFVDGSDPLQFGHVNTGKAVGGSTVHFTAIKLRLQPDDFRLKTLEGIGEDWPLTYEDLQPYYEKAEDFVGVSGPRNAPWPGFRQGYPQGELPLNAADEVIATGFEKLGFEWVMAPHAVLTGEKEGRSPCMFYGFCEQGCKSDAKGSTLVTWIPKAVKAGAEIRENCFATQVTVDSEGRAKSVVYVHEGKTYEQQARIIIVACYSVETPRLLLHSACGQYPNGLANSSGLVGKNLMVHPGVESYGHFPDPLDSFVTPPVGIITLDTYGTREGKDYKRGYVMNRYAHFPIQFIANLASENKGLWGRELHRIMDDYPHWAILATMNEMLPRPDNQVTLSDVPDQNGVPYAKVTMSYDENDRKMIEDSKATCERILKEAGADMVLSTQGAVHLLGTCRMGNDPATSVVRPDCRSHDIDNLYICDGSVFVTEGAVNPSLTIEAIALRTAEGILARANG